MAGKLRTSYDAVIIGAGVGGGVARAGAHATRRIAARLAQATPLRAVGFALARAAGFDPAVLSGGMSAGAT